MPPEKSHRAKQICFVSPTYFSNDSIIGGGERYVEELAKGVALLRPVKFISFGKTNHRDNDSTGVERVILKSWSRTIHSPFSPLLFRELASAAVIHCFQYFTLSTFLAVLYGYLRRIPVFVTDLGGGGWTPAYHIDQSRWITAHLPLTEYAARNLPGRNQVHHIIYGGVNLNRYTMRDKPTHDGSVVFLGRLLPHKGIHYLIEAMAPDRRLVVIGPNVNDGYFQRLLDLAKGKSVVFRHDLSDHEVIGHLQRAMLLAHPTPVDAQGSAGVNELFGLALVEAMACGCPVIASRAASLPEIVENGDTGILVPPNDPSAIASAIDRVGGDPALWQRLSTNSRLRVEAQFTWDRVSERCVSYYKAGRL